MITATTPDVLRHHVTTWRGAGDTVGFVPTMGALHAGHLALVERSRALAARTVVSIFVNPTQFDRADDLDAYPRTPERDAGLLRDAGADLLFLPPVDAIYPPGDATRVRVAGPAEGLEGAERPGHFDGVATVVTRLFNLVQPDLAVFGEKDAQQLAVVRRMVRDLHQPVEIVGHPTVREADGLALSSRNARLSDEDRRRALALSRALADAHQAAAAGERDADALRRRMRQSLESALGKSAPGESGSGNSGPGDGAGDIDGRVEYAEVVDGESFQPLDRLPETGRVILPVAAWVGGVRLIDNVQWEMSELGGDAGAGPPDSEETACAASTGGARSRSS